MSLSQVYENGPDESEQILQCIEKQAVVQAIIKEFAEHLVSGENTAVSEPLPDYYTVCILHFIGWELMQAEELVKFNYYILLASTPFC